MHRVEQTAAQGTAGTWMAQLKGDGQRYEEQIGISQCFN
jgi:hypothetical protein